LDHRAAAARRASSCRSAAESERARAAAARCAISLRRRGLRASARARPPFAPPRRPRATACGFFMAASMMNDRRRSGHFGDCPAHRPAGAGQPRNLVTAPAVGRGPPHDGGRERPHRSRRLGNEADLCIPAQASTRTWASMAAKSRLVQFRPLGRMLTLLNQRGAS